MGSALKATNFLPCTKNTKRLAVGLGSTDVILLLLYK